MGVTSETEIVALLPFCPLVIVLTASRFAAYEYLFYLHTFLVQINIFSETRLKPWIA